MRILIASPIDRDAVERLSDRYDVHVATAPTPDQLRDLIQDKEVLVFRSGITLSADVLEAARELRLVVRAGSGFDNLDLETLERRRIPLVRIPRPSAQAVAEMALALMFALARNVPHADSLIRRGVWAKHELNGYLLSGKTLGVVGVGNIGGRMAEIGLALGMRVIGCCATWSPERALKLGGVGIELTDFGRVVSAADFLTVHVPLNDTTRGLIDASVLARMKRGAFLVNTSRGGVVVERDLQAALQEGRLLGAGLDVHEHEGKGQLSPFASFHNVVLTPHIGASTVDTQREIGVEICAILDAFERGVLEPSPLPVSALSAA